MADAMGISHTSVQRIWAEHGLKRHFVLRNTRACLQLSRMIAEASSIPARKFLASLS